MHHSIFTRDSSIWTSETIKMNLLHHTECRVEFIPNGTKGVFREVYSIHRQGSTLTKPKQVFKLLTLMHHNLLQSSIDPRFVVFYSIKHGRLDII